MIHSHTMNFASGSHTDRSDSIAADARAALMRGDHVTALSLLRRLPTEEAGVGVRLDLALALRMAGDLPAAISALDSVLVLEPRNFLALLSKGALLEALGRRRGAAAVYKAAIDVAPAETPRELQAPLEKARAAVHAEAEALAEHMTRAIAPLKAQYSGEDLRRFDEALLIFAGLARPYSQTPALLHYPRLPAVPFYDRAMFPWLGELEAASEIIRGETQALLAMSTDLINPYVAFPPGVPVDQWSELNHSPRWSAFFLWENGVRQDGACALCPQTAKILETLPLAYQEGYAPTVTLSVLAPHTHIPPHTGSANSRLLVHLPLILPGPARFRVGAETRDWRMGEAWVFDDTVEHEAWNDADAARTILIFDIWNPLLTEAERALITAMMAAQTAFLGSPA